MAIRTRSSIRKRLFSSDRALARFVFWVFLALFVGVATGLPDRRAGEIEFQVTSALATEGRLTFDASSSPEAAGLIAAYEDGAPILRSLMQRSDERYANRGEVGHALLGAPLHWLGQLVAKLDPQREASFAAHGFWRDAQSDYYAHLFVGMRNPLLGALTAYLIVLLVLQLGLGHRWALLGGLAFGLTSFALAQARATLADVQGACALLAALHMLLLMRSRIVIGARARVEHAVFLGLFLALAFLTRFELFLACLVVWTAAAQLFWSRDKRALVAMSALVVVGLGTFVGFNLVRFGTPLGFDPGALARSVLEHDPLGSLLGLLISPNKGLFFFAPFALLVFVAPRQLEPGTQRFFLMVGGLVVVAVVLPVLLIGGWHGGWSFGPRAVLAALPPLFVIATAVAAKVWQRTGWRVSIVGLLVLGAVTNLPAVFVDHTTAEDLTLQAAAHEWPDQDPEALWEEVQWDWRYAAPFLYWRIFRHRVALGSEAFHSSELFFAEPGGPLVVDPELRSGMRHMAWVDHRAEGGVLWPMWLFLAGCSVMALRAGIRAADG